MKKWIKRILGGIDITRYRGSRGHYHIRKPYCQNRGGNRGAEGAGRPGYAGQCACIPSARTDHPEKF